jgi:hypothetical protein
MSRLVGCCIGAIIIEEVSNGLAATFLSRAFQGPWRAY